MPRQTSGERAIGKPADQSLPGLSFLGRAVALREFASILSREGYTPECKSLAQDFVECALESGYGLPKLAEADEV